ncbi:uncharacterized protein PAC_16984 [Phialocephala subalpina]|uniref:Uncharacterized protein n=1 Tax=Phialocephala subalpina TaxID=576137 RepID=A0A1L7XPZ2_9HELO|nr:uncharacterized protein PAC_16984 [Phialocephala subalpina]
MDLLKVVFQFGKRPRSESGDPIQVTYNSDHPAKQIKLKVEQAPNQIKQETDSKKRRQNKMTTKGSKNSGPNGLHAIRARVAEVSFGTTPTFPALLDKVHRILQTADPIPEDKIRIIVPCIVSHFKTDLSTAGPDYIKMALRNPYKKTFVKAIYDSITDRIHNEAMKVAQSASFQQGLLLHQQELEKQAQEQQAREQAAMQRQQELEQQVKENQARKQAAQEQQAREHHEIQQAARRCQQELEQAAPEKAAREQQAMHQAALRQQQEEERQIQERHAREQQQREAAAARERQAREEVALKRQRELEQREAGLRRQQELLQEALKQKAELVENWLKDIPFIFPFSKDDLDAVKELLEAEVSRMAAQPASGASPYVCHLCPDSKTGSIREFIGHMYDSHNLLFAEQDAKTNLSPFRCPGCPGKWLSRDSLLKHYKKEEACHLASRMRNQSLEL